MYDKVRPLVFGHRGAMAYAPMNTMAAFELAYQQLADGIELDVWLSQDDVPVVIHDFSVDATTDGEGRVGSLPYRELKALDAGSWFDPRFTGERIPTLDEVFETVGQKLLINVEIKSIDLRKLAVVDETLKRIRAHHLEERVLISSFNPFVVREVRKQAPDLPVGFLRAGDVARWLNLVTIGTDYDAWHPHHEQVTHANVERMKQQGRQVNVWTVNEPEDAIRLAAIGVSGIITDKPDVILKALDSRDA